MRLKICLLLYCMFLSVLLSAQASKKSVRAYIAALHYEAEKKQDRAYKKMLKAIKISPSSPDAYSQLGQWYFAQHKFMQAAEIFKAATLHCRNGKKQFARPFAKSLLYCGLADSAMQIINAFSNLKAGSEWEKMRLQAIFIKQAYMQSQLQWPVNLGDRVNTMYPELFPFISSDTGTLYFTRRVNNMDEDFYRADADSCGGWFYARNLGGLPNTPDQESAQFISADGHYLFFTRCENRSQDGWAEGGCDLFMAYRINEDSNWTIAQPFGSTINTTDYEGMPSLSPDNRELYFVSDRMGGYGGYDIWISHFEDGLWQPPVNAGPQINTSGNETAPFIALDNKTLFFTSDGWPGMGGTDIFMSRKRTGLPGGTFSYGASMSAYDTLWSKAINLGYPVNTSCDEQSECITSNGEKLYFASDRNGPTGNFDLFETQLPITRRPVPTRSLEGYVYDSLTKTKLNYAIIHVCNAFTGDTIYEFQSNRGDGSFTIVLPLGNTYAIHTARMGYTERNDTLLFDTATASHGVIRNITMLPSDYIKPLNDTLIASLHFDVNRAELSEMDILTLKATLSPWLKQEGISVYVNGYTDNTGTPMLNEELSYKRAAIVAAEIIRSGLSNSIVHSKGWGEAKMISQNDTEEGQRINRRVEVIIRY